MARNTRIAIVKRNTNPATIRHIASQIKRMADAEVYALTYAADRTLRQAADREAHKRAEAYAMGE